MRKIFLMLLACMLCFAAGCNSAQEDESPVSDMPLEDILAYIYENAGIELPMLATVEINDENQQFYLGTTDLVFTEAVASEPMISAIAYSLCLVRFEDAETAEAAKEKIAASVDPRKWICVEVPEDKVITERAGNVVALFMMEDSATLHEKFMELANG